MTHPDLLAFLGIPCRIVEPPTACDRCGADGEITEWRAHRPTHDHPVGEVAMCRDCTGEMMEWVGRGKP